MNLYGFSLQLFSELLDFCEFYSSQHFAIPRSIFAIVSHMNLFFMNSQKNEKIKRENCAQNWVTFPAHPDQPPSIRTLRRFARFAASLRGLSERKAPFQEGAGHVLHGLGVAGNQIPTQVG